MTLYHPNLVCFFLQPFILHHLTLFLHTKLKKKRKMKTMWMVLNDTGKANKMCFTKCRLSCETKKHVFPIPGVLSQNRGLQICQQRLETAAILSLCAAAQRSHGLTGSQSSVQPRNVNSAAATKPGRRRFNFSTATHFKVDALCSSLQNLD